MERDPVCGMNVDPEKAKAKVEHGGQSYYFCGAGCAKRFEQAPGQFLSGVAPSAVSIKGKGGDREVPIAGFGDG